MWLNDCARTDNSGGAFVGIGIGVPPSARTTLASATCCTGLTMRRLRYHAATAANGESNGDGEDERGQRYWSQLPVPGRPCVHVEDARRAASCARRRSGAASPRLADADVPALGFAAWRWPRRASALAVAMPGTLRLSSPLPRGSRRRPSSSAASIALWPPRPATVAPRSCGGLQLGHALARRPLLVALLAAARRARHEQEEHEQRDEDRAEQSGARRTVARDRLTQSRAETRTKRRRRSRAAPETATVATRITSSRCPSRYRLVAGAAHRLDEVRTAELGAHLGDVLVDGARAAGVLETPDAVEQYLA